MATILKTSASEISDYFINCAFNREKPLSNYKLQKLLYYAQGWSLGINKEILFDEDFEAWIHGPVILAIFNKYKNGIHPNNSLADNINENQKGFLNKILDDFLYCEDWELERMIKQEDPWIMARAGLAMDESCHNLISKESLKAFFSKRVSK